MDRNPNRCRMCAAELTGTKANEFITIGNFVHLVTRDSLDCNWHRCSTCKDVLCKECYAEQFNFCCEGDCIAQREQAQMLADSQNQQTGGRKK